MKWISNTFPNLHIHGLARFVDGVFRTDDPVVINLMAGWEGRYGVTRTDDDPTPIPPDPWPQYPLEAELFDGTGRVLDARLPERLADDALRAAFGTGDWRDARAVDVTALPRFEDRPTIGWTNTHTTSGLTSPVTYRPSVCNTGAQVVGWGGQDDPNIAFFPGSYQTANGPNNDLIVRGESKPDSTTAYRWPLVFSFTTSAGVNDVEIAFYGGVNIQSAMVEVNGRLIDDSVLWSPSTFTVTSATLRLTFPTAQARTIRIWTAPGLGLYAIRVPTAQTISKPSNPGPTVAFIGDSFVNGAGESRSYPDQGANAVETFAPRLGRMMGAGAMVLAGIGGSGWVSAGSGSKYGSRADEVMAMGPDIVVFYGSTNDGILTTGIAAEVTAALTTCAAADEVYVIGPLRDTIYGDVNNAIKTATEAAGRTFIDMRGFIFGAGKVTAPAGDGGNADLFLMNDGAHPTLDAHRAIARQAFALMHARGAA